MPFQASDANCALVEEGTRSEEIRPDLAPEMASPPSRRTMSGAVAAVALSHAAFNAS